MDVEDFLRDDIAVEEYSRESYPIDDFCWLRGHTHETPDGEECYDWIDDESEVGEGDSRDHRVGVDDDIRTLKCRIDITCTGNCDSCDRMEELIGSIAQICSVSECYESEYEDKDVFLFHTS